MIPLSLKKSRLQFPAIFDSLEKNVVNLNKNAFAFVKKKKKKKKIPGVK